MTLAVVKDRRRLAVEGLIVPLPAQTAVPDSGSPFFFNAARR
jgi:hypothetical protein